MRRAGLVAARALEAAAGSRGARDQRRRPRDVREYVGHGIGSRIHVEPAQPNDGGPGRDW
jgi:methionine aminopeptidase